MDKLIEALSLLRDTIDGVGRAATETANNPKWRYHRDTPHMKTMAGVYAEWATAVQFIIDNLPALSHAAGQDGEQCRAASAFELLELAAIFESCVPFLPPVGQRNITKAVAELRALSRGVPEGST